MIEIMAIAQIAPLNCKAACREFVLEILRGRTMKARVYSNTPIFALLVLLLLSFTACSAKPRWQTVPGSSSGLSASAEPVWKAPLPGQVGPGNLIRVKSPDPKVSGEYRIEFNNTLKLPYDVKINTRGMTESKLTEAVRNAYRPYFRNPSDVSVAIAKKEYLVEVQGLVQKPGIFLLSKDASLDELMSQAGGVVDSSNPAKTARYARITGPSGTGLIRLADYHSGRAVSLPSWQGGETVFFQTEGGTRRGAKSDTIHLLGQVRNPGEYAVLPGGEFYTYLVKAGGPTDRADTANVSIIRTQDGVTQTMNFDMMDADQVPPLVGGDAIIVNADNASPLEKKSRIAAQIANVLSAIGIVVIAANN